MKVAIVIPTYNESGAIRQLLNSLEEVLSHHAKHAWYIVIVDANSPDGTATLVREYASSHPRVHLIVEAEKRGIGAAYGQGFLYSLNELGADVIMSFDGDGQHNPEDIPRLVSAIEQGADYTIGSRYIKGGAVPQEWAAHRKILSRFGSLYARLLLELPIHDVTSGFRAMRRTYVERLPLRPEQILSRQYAYIFQFTHEMSRMGARIVEVPIIFGLREHDTSKSRALRDIVESLRVTGILRLRTLKEWRLIRVVLVGATGFILQTALFELLGFTFDLLRPSTAVVVGGEAAILSNFFLNSYFSFRDLHKESAPILTRLIRFHVSCPHVDRYPMALCARR
jgi:dolichol-phosphate mannosyltransferase